MRTDENNNPTAFTTALASQATGLVKGVDWEDGEPFPGESTLVTAKILGDPIAVTIRLIDQVGYYTQGGVARWSYIAMPKFVWNALSAGQKRDVIGFHYQHEGGVAMRHLFPNYGNG